MIVHAANRVNDAQIITAKTVPVFAANACTSNTRVTN